MIVFKPLVWLVRPLLAPPRDFRGPGSDPVLPHFLAWRRSMLVLVLLFTAFTAAIDTATKLVSGPQPSFDLLSRLDPDAEPVEQTFFGDLAELVWLLSFYAMPA